jgi:hypothetical protein
MYPDHETAAPMVGSTASIMTISGQMKPSFMTVLHKVMQSSPVFFGLFAANMLAFPAYRSPFTAT